MGKFHADLEAHLNFSKFCEPAKCSVIFIQSLAYLTPIVFLILPRIQGTTTPPIKENEKTNQCDIGCEGKKGLIFEYFWDVGSQYLNFASTSKNVTNITISQGSIHFKGNIASKILVQKLLES